jgi:hypothetical protein
MHAELGHSSSETKQAALGHAKALTVPDARAKAINRIFAIGNVSLQSVMSPRVSRLPVLVASYKSHKGYPVTRINPTRATE